MTRSAATRLWLDELGGGVPLDARATLRCGLRRRWATTCITRLNSTVVGGFAGVLGHAVSVAL